MPRAPVVPGRIRTYKQIALPLKSLSLPAPLTVQGSYGAVPALAVTTLSSVVHCAATGLIWRTVSGVQPALDLNSALRQKRILAVAERQRTAVFRHSRFLAPKVDVRHRNLIGPYRNTTTLTGIYCCST